MLRGWWVGRHEIGGVLVVAVTANRARQIGAAEMGVDYIAVSALRVPALDGYVQEGVVDWEHGKALGAVAACEACGEEYAVTARYAGRRCGECEEVPM